MQKYVVRISGYPGGSTNREDFIAASEIEAAARAVRRFDGTPGGVPEGGKLEVRLLPGGIARPFEVSEARKWLERNGGSLGEDEG